jgi:molybdenum cofactor cytidylyltransferase
MSFGPAHPRDALGAILAHGVDVGGARLAKGRVLNAADIAALIAEGRDSVIVARVGPEELAENDAASRITAPMAGPGLRADKAATGRVNLLAETPGVFRVNARAVHAINAVDPALTVATLPDFSVVQAGAMVATAKIIPFSVRASSVALAESKAAGILALHPFAPLKAALIQTTLPILKDSVIAKTVSVTEARVAAHGGRFTDLGQTPHSTAALAARLAEAVDADLVIVFGASAMTDFDDVIPSAIRACGGTVVRAGMPVDPGNLLVLGRIGKRIVIGAPGCARSPKENGFDWVLARVFAGITITARDIARMGVGGLLMEIPTRPRPRDGGTHG